MADSHRTDGSHALDAGSAGDRDAKIEQLLLTGLDHYFGGQYDQAINVWTRALFLDRNHARARAYIERARSALAERQRRSEEMLQDGVAAFQRGDGEEARRLLRAAIEQGAPADEAFTILNRLDRLDRLDPVDHVEAPPAAPAPGADTREAERRTAFPVAAPAVPARGRVGRIAGLGLLVALAVVAGAIAATWAGWRWPAVLSLIHI